MGINTSMMSSQLILHIKSLSKTLQSFPYGRQSEVLGFSKNVMPHEENYEEYKYSIIGNMSDAVIASFK